MDGDAVARRMREPMMPIFLLAEDGALWAYDDIREVGPLADGVVIGGWDASGSAITVSRGSAGRIAVAGVDSAGAHRVEFESMLRDRLRERRVRDVDSLGFDDLVFKASVRFTTEMAPAPGLWSGILEGITTFFAHRP